VEKTKCYQEISGKKYLQVEAWETIGAFNRTHAETESIEPVLKEEKTIGYQAHVQLWKDGIVVGGAIMPCYFTENCCKGKEGDAKHKACMSAAQTFATSKAYRMNYSFVAILAGYQPLPAEEITKDMQGEANKTQHYCTIHKTNFFMKGKMKSYAHPIEGTDPVEWCHEHKPTEKPNKDTQAEKDLSTVFPETEPSEASPLDETKVTEEDLAQLNKLMAEGHVSAEQLGTYIKKDKGWAEVKTLPDLKKWQFKEILEAFQRGSK